MDVLVPIKCFIATLLLHLKMIFGKEAFVDRKVVSMTYFKICVAQAAQVFRRGSVPSILLPELNVWAFYMQISELKT